MSGEGAFGKAGFPRVRSRNPLPIPMASANRGRRACEPRVAPSRPCAHGAAGLDPGFPNLVGGLPCAQARCRCGGSDHVLVDGEEVEKGAGHDEHVED